MKERPFGKHCHPQVVHVPKGHCSALNGAPPLMICHKAGRGPPDGSFCKLGVLFCGCRYDESPTVRGLC